MSRIPGLRAYQLTTFAGLVANVRHRGGQTLTVMFPRQAGKNEISAWLVSALLIANQDRGGSVVVCAPTLRPQLSVSLDRTMGYLSRRARQLRVLAARRGNVIHCGAASAVFLSGSPSANVAGHTASLLLIGDEAQDLDADWFNRQFKPMTSSTGAPTVLFGTPWSGNSLLEDAVAENLRHDATVPPEELLIPGRTWHHQYAWAEVARYNEPYGRFVEGERERLGDRHPAYLSQYELVAAAAENRLLTSENLASAARDLPALDDPLPGERYVAGLDFAGEAAGGDSTVLTVSRCTHGGIEVVAVYEWTGVPYQSQLEAVVALARHWDLARMVCDATGLGAALVSQLKRALGARVVALPFSRPEKSALGFALQAAAETHRLGIPVRGTPAVQLLWRELRACRVELAGRFQIGWAAPPGEHDDCVVSLALCLRAAETAGGERKAQGRSRAA